jgi:SAM-dependent methyltransferase
LTAVLSPDGSERRNLYLHTVSLYAAHKALAQRREPGVLLDFGCGTGRMLRFFAGHGWSVIGTEISFEMLEAAQHFGLPPKTAVIATNGVSIPLADASVDLIWVCGVLKYGLFPPGAVCRGGSGLVSAEDAPHAQPFTPVYYEIAREMYRVLKPGARVVNNEMYVDADPDVFTRDFERAGFSTKDVRVLQRYFEPFAKPLQSKRVPLWVVKLAARVYAFRRFHADNARRHSAGLRDYLFVWEKPEG